MNRRLFALLAVPAAVAFPAGTAFANSFGADADCQGLTFSMARGEAGTVVEATVDGRRVAISTVANHGAPVGFTVPNPDPSRAHTWVVIVDSVFNPGQRWSETVGVCVAPTTVPAPTTTSSTVPNPSTTVGTTVPTTVPTASTTVVTTPRPTVPPTTVPFRLPDTGRDTSRLTGFAVGCLLGGLILLAVIRRDGAK